MNKITNKVKQSFAIFLIFMLVFAMFPGAIGAEEDHTVVPSDKSIPYQDVTADEQLDEDKESIDTSNEDDLNDEESSKEDEEGSTSKEDTSHLEKNEETSIGEKEKSENDPDAEKAEVENDEKESAKAKSNSTKKSSHDADAINKEVEKAIEKAKKYYEENQPYDRIDDLGEQYKGSSSDYWFLSALWGAGYTNLENDFPWKNKSPWSKDNYWTVQEEKGVFKEEVGIIIGSVLLNQDPDQFGEENIVQKLLDSQNDEGMFYDEWGESWALIALDLVDAEYDQDAHIQSILNLQRDDGMFGGEWTDLDAMGWMLLALAPYMDENEEVTKAVEKSVNLAHEIFMENEEFQGDFGANANTTSSIIMGLAAVGEDLYSEKWSKDSGSLVEQLIAYQQEDNGSFEWQKGNDFGIEMATEQSLLALATVKNGQSLFIDLKNYEPEAPEEEPEEEPEEGEKEPDPNPKPDPEVSDSEKKVNVNERVSVAKGETWIINDGKSKITVPDNLPEGVYLTVTNPDKKIMNYQKQNLKLAGDWFDFNFEGIEDFTGEFTLTLAVNEDVSLDKAGVYHYNEETNQWEYIEGIKNAKDHTITVEVSNFSIYGVFVEEEKETAVETVAENNTDNQKVAGERLPDTATNTFNMMLIGLLLLTLGSALLFIRVKKSQKTT